MHKKMSHQQIYALRLHPGQDLKQEIISYTKANHIDAGYIITCVGSLKKLSLRLANQSEISSWENKFEIVSLVGTISEGGLVHLHMSVADSTGKTIGGHLADGNIIYTTAEIVIGATREYKFTRSVDSVTTYNELLIEKK